MSHDAFLSYARIDDEREGEDGICPITALRSALERSLSAYLGRSAKIYQDKDGLKVGQVWERELQSALRCPCLIPVVTPGYLKSEYCVNELIDFATLEARKQQIDRIVPLYYIEAGVIEQRQGRPSRLADDLYNTQAIDILMQRQMEDIRWFRKLSPQQIINDCEARAVLDRVARELAARTLGTRRTAPTMVVAREGAGLRSISSAIRRAEPGARILVRGGRAEYCESLIIDKPLEIIGEPRATLVGIGGPAIACTGAGAPVRIAKLNVTAKGFNGVIISGGYCVLQELEISRTGYSAVLIRDGAESVIIKCSLHHSEHSGVHAQLGSKCTVVCSTISENGSGGLFYSQDAEGLAEGNLIERNKVIGIYITAGANPCIRRNRIRHHPGAGILVYRHGRPGEEDMWDYGPGRGIIEDNDITDGDQFGIQIEDGADPCVRRNTIKANAWGGILTRKGGCGTIYDNQILENCGDGIKNEGGHPRIGRNVIAGNGGYPVEDPGGGAIFDEQASCRDQETMMSSEPEQGTR